MEDAMEGSKSRSRRGKAYMIQFDVVDSEFAICTSLIRFEEIFDGDRAVGVV